MLSMKGNIFMTYFDLVYDVINDYIAHNNITSFNTEPYIKQFQAIRKKTGIYYDNYYRSIFQRIIIHMRHHNHPFYLNKNPEKIIYEKDRISMPVLQYDGKIYLYDNDNVKNYIIITNYNNWFEITCFYKKYQFLFEKETFVNPHKTNLIYPFIYNNNKLEMKNMNLLVFGSPSGDEKPFAKFANQITTKDNFYFVGYDFKKNQILPRPTLNDDVLKMLITPVI